MCEDFSLTPGFSRVQNRRRYAGAADGCLVDLRSVLRRQIRVRDRSRRQRLAPGQAGRGHSAGLGWTDVGGFRGAHDRDQSASGTGAAALGAQAGRCCGQSEFASGVRRGTSLAELEELTMGDVVRLDGECAEQATSALAAAGLLRLWEPA